MIKIKQQKLTQKKHWNKVHQKGRLSQVKTNVFDFALRRHLDRARPGQQCIELGCIPGRFLIYLNKQFGYIPEGLDYSAEISSVADNLKKYGINNFQLYHKDLVNWSSKKKYSLVCSFGLVEHFADPQPIIQKHFDLVEAGGQVIISVPKQVGLQGRVIKYIDPQATKRHNPLLMSPARLKKAIQKSGGVVVYCNYVGTFGFFGGTKNNKKTVLQHIVFWFLVRMGYRIQCIFNILGIEISNKYFSPHILCVAKKE